MSMIFRIILLSLLLITILWFGLSGLFKLVGTFTKAYGKEFKQKLEENDNE